MIQRLELDVMLRQMSALVGHNLRKRSSVPASQVELFEIVHLTKVPADLAAVWTKYDLRSWQIGSLAFGIPGGKSYLEMYNHRANEYGWWLPGMERPEQLFFIALGDPLAVLMDFENETVYSYVQEQGWRSRTRAGHGFTNFITWAGSVLLENRTLSPEEYEQLRQEVGFDANDALWRTFLSG